jgi:hypothetical protein
LPNEEESYSATKIIVYTLTKISSGVRKDKAAFRMIDHESSIYYHISVVDTCSTSNEQVNNINMTMLCCQMNGCPINLKQMQLDYILHNFGLTLTMSTVVHIHTFVLASRLTPALSNTSAVAVWPY